MRRDLDVSAVASAFHNATFGMSGEEKSGFERFMLRFLKQSEEFERKEKWRSHMASTIGISATNNPLVRKYGTDVLIAEDFIARAMINEGTLAKKVMESRIFTLPYWSSDFPVLGKSSIRRFSLTLAILFRHSKLRQW